MLAAVCKHSAAGTAAARRTAVGLDMVQERRKVDCMEDMSHRRVEVD